MSSTSLLNPYLPGYAREQVEGPYADRLAYDDLREQLDAAAHAPRGERVQALQRLAGDWGVSLRTLQRYIKHRHGLRTIELAGWQAAFYLGPGGRPIQATPWRPV